MTDTDSRPMLTSAEVMEHLRIGQTTFYRLVATGELKPVEVPSETGKRQEFRFEQAELDEFKARNRRTA